MEELYKKYAGTEVINKPFDSDPEAAIFKGIICGYTSETLMFAVTQIIEAPWSSGYKWLDKNTHVITHANNYLGYWEIKIKDLPKL